MNRKPTARLVAALLMLAAVFPVATVGATPEPGNIYLAFGDSLAEGSGATDPSQLGYVPHLYGFFRGVPHGDVNSYTNLGIGGETSTSFITGGQLAEGMAIITNPDTSIGVVTFDIGGNDLLYLLTTEPCLSDPTGTACYLAAMATITTFAQNYYYILNTLTPALAADSGNPELLIMTYYNPWSGTGSPMAAQVDAVLFGSDGTIDCIANQTDPMRIGINDATTCIGQMFGATIADAYPRFEGKGAVLTHITEGDIHPNNAGYAQIANVFKEAYLGR
jgi:lysophospholipase L1-like esterase